MYEQELTVGDIYLTIARNSEVFKSVEIDTLNEVVEDYRGNPGTTYRIFEEKDGDRVVGFVIFGRTPMPEFAWDIYWLVVDRHFQRRSMGKRLITKVQDFLSAKYPKAILRVETSSRVDYSAARNFYLKQDFKEAGRIKDFYEDGDDLVVFVKYIENKENHPASVGGNSL